MPGSGKTFTVDKAVNFNLNRGMDIQFIRSVGRPILLEENRSLIVIDEIDLLPATQLQRVISASAQTPIIGIANSLPPRDQKFELLCFKPYDRPQIHSIMLDSFPQSKFNEFALIYICSRVAAGKSDIRQCLQLLHTLENQDVFEKEIILKLFKCTTESRAQMMKKLPIIQQMLLVYAFSMMRTMETAMDEASFKRLLILNWQQKNAHTIGNRDLLDCIDALFANGFILKKGKTKKCVCLAFQWEDLLELKNISESEEAGVLLGLIRTESVVQIQMQPQQKKTKIVA